MDQAFATLKPHLPDTSVLSREYDPFLTSGCCCQARRRDDS